jgi:hypothetical protein
MACQGACHVHVHGKDDLPCTPPSLAVQRAAGPVDGIYWCVSVGAEIPGATGRHFNEIFAYVLPQVCRVRARVLLCW